MLLSLGSFQFEVDSAAYDSLKVTASYPWAKVERMGNTPQLQALGKEHRTISISGVVFPTYQNVGIAQIEQLRLLASLMQPQIMLSGTGLYLGKWCIMSIDEDDSYFFENGAPRKQSFSLELERYSDDKKS